MTSVVLMAGGYGTRLREVTNDLVPKPMVAVPFRGQQLPLLEFVLTRYYEQGLHDLVVCVGHLGAQIRAYFGDGSEFGLRMRYSDSGDVGTARRLRDALELVPNEDVIVACADVHHSLDLVALQASARSDDDALAFVLLAEPSPADDRPPNVALDPAGCVIDYDWGTRRGALRAYDSGVLLARARLAGRLPPHAQASINCDLYPELVRAGELRGCLDAGVFRDIGTPERYAEFCRFVDEGGALPLSFARASGAVEWAAKGSRSRASNRP